MAKRDWSTEKEEIVEAPEMTLEEAKAFRASLHKPTETSLTAPEKREAFRKFWAMNKSRYGKTKDIEPVLWVHLEASGFSDPAKFVEGLEHFGLKRSKK
jgi:hypothetical protein